MFNREVTNKPDLDTVKTMFHDIGWNDIDIDIIAPLVTKNPTRTTTADAIQSDGVTPQGGYSHTWAWWECSAVTTPILGIFNLIG